MLCFCKFSLKPSLRRFGHGRLRWTLESGWPNRVLVFSCLLRPHPSPVLPYSHATLSHTTHVHTTYSHTTYSHTTYSHTHTQVSHTHTTYSHTTHSHNLLTHTPLTHTHNSYTHKTYSHTTYSHTTHRHTHTYNLLILIHNSYTHTQLTHTHTHKPSLCVAGVALLALGWLWWRTWVPWSPLLFALQAWHLVTSTFTLRGRRGTWRHRPAFCVAGVVLMALGSLWWRAWVPCLDVLCAC